MPKASNDLILRDRLQFDITSGTDRTTLYGRLDLSDYVNVVKKDGLSIKELYIQPRVPNGDTGFGINGQLNQTGIFSSAWFLGYIGEATNDNAMAGLKIYASTRAYQNASDVGIASPDVLCVEEWHCGFALDVNTAAELPKNFGVSEYRRFGPKDLHPDGFIVVSDLLIGVAADNMTIGPEDSTTPIELDIMLIAEPVKITQARLDEMLAQAQDL
tara:strand:- start:178 stop:822 length:645 start_codon:yes stop_codon:yes gene_type:complete